MIIYMPDPLDLLKDIRVPEQRTMTLPSGGLVNIEIIDKQQARVVGIVSTDPMDYMDNRLQPGSVLDISFKV